MPASAFSRLERHSARRTNVLDAVRDELPGREKVDALIAQGQELIEAEMASRVAGKFVVAKNAYQGCVI